MPASSISKLFSSHERSRSGSPFPGRARTRRLSLLPDHREAFLPGPTDRRKMDLARLCDPFCAISPSLRMDRAIDPRDGRMLLAYIRLGMSWSHERRNPSRKTQGQNVESSDRILLYPGDPRGSEKAPRTKISFLIRYRRTERSRRNGLSLTKAHTRGITPIDRPRSSSLLALLTGAHFFTCPQHRASTRARLPCDNDEQGRENYFVNPKAFEYERRTRKEGRG